MESVSHTTSGLLAVPSPRGEVAVTVTVCPPVRPTHGETPTVPSETPLYLSTSATTSAGRHVEGGEPQVPSH